jgi:hypothetical protein
LKKTETDPEMIYLKSEDKNFKQVIINMFKDLREKMDAIRE